MDKVRSTKSQQPKSSFQKEFKCIYISFYIFNQKKTVKQIYNITSKVFSCRNLNWLIENSYLIIWNKYVCKICFKHFESHLAHPVDVIFERNGSNNIGNEVKELNTNGSAVINMLNNSSISD